ncbi:MAG: hypothetical protein A2600_08155 [Candidatus Lambdaproteobacteria bacterium RIFOXYD1_FULL_56_27]|uniref:Uncharacterized protein n=1 Tax=Candidatus Lambdaproteobacteria bacterium RIFOXYD2_FULL_56_26 TaxID=1817773 RepID=A0A1F6GVJ0_9PROT|nr:MAG: hypothetical protein A2557_05140 [Candidatus Lambdaproteobacteria bacterium RIFOXYD2_FULL_56_26]OGH03280.1 MAG: hypothetical protein A2426_06950 [Candidatus Lambdaproteobacteria bacterium RIFOXYC1_FULL_56_13]OGH07478.1 MAG: hypothetical protein A2600_08155 [Candidatus Lambdaproteobacteria bacterium RIFOXYD1_FULL_56_27]
MKGGNRWVESPSLRNYPQEGMFFELPSEERTGGSSKRTKPRFQQPLRAEPMKTWKLILTLLGLALALSPQLWAKTNDEVGGYKKPQVCLDSNIRCILKHAGDVTYWCLKSNIQRELDMRREGPVITKTLNDKMGHCAKIIPLDNYPKE